MHKLTAIPCHIISELVQGWAYILMDFKHRGKIQLCCKQCMAMCVYICIYPYFMGRSGNLSHGKSLKDETILLLKASSPSPSLSGLQSAVWTQSSYSRDHLGSQLIPTQITRHQMTKCKNSGLCHILM